MSTMQKEVDPDTGLTDEETGEIIDRYLELMDAGKKEEAIKLVNQYFPVPPYLADTAKRIMGVEDLKASGLNLSAAIKFFGKEWLECDG